MFVTMTIDFLLVHCCLYCSVVSILYQGCTKGQKSGGPPGPPACCMPVYMYAL